MWHDYDTFKICIELVVKLLESVTVRIRYYVPIQIATSRDQSFEISLKCAIKAHAVSPLLTLRTIIVVYN